jgi:hypothetical protein
MVEAAGIEPESASFSTPLSLRELRDKPNHVSEMRALTIRCD